jgi:hypothetical protein
VSGPAGVMALVLAEAAAGATALLFLQPLWHEVRRGFFYLTGAIVLALAAAAAGAAAMGFDAAHADAGRLAVALSVALAGATGLWLALLFAGAHGAARILGFGTVPLAVAMLVGFARLADEPFTVSFFQLLGGALFTGAVLDGLLLGHWYLTDRRLSRGPINRMAALLMAAVGVEAIAIIAGGFGEQSGPGSPAAAALNPLLTLAGSATWIAFGMVTITGLVALMIWLALRGTRPTAVQGATGFFYVAVITAFTGELAAKIRFLP